MANDMFAQINKFREASGPKKTPLPDDYDETRAIEGILLYILLQLTAVKARGLAVDRNQ
jgi:hypothetical protein